MHPNPLTGRFGQIGNWPMLVGIVVGIAEATALGIDAAVGIAGIAAASSIDDTSG